MQDEDENDRQDALEQHGGELHNFSSVHRRRRQGCAGGDPFLQFSCLISSKHFPLALRRHLIVIRGLDACKDFTCSGIALFNDTHQSGQA